MACDRRTLLLAGALALVSTATPASRAGAKTPIAVIGGGNIGGTIGGLWVKAGHPCDVRLAPPGGLKPLVEKLGPLAKAAGTVEQPSRGDACADRGALQGLSGAGQDHGAGPEGQGRAGCRQRHQGPRRRAGGGGRERRHRRHLGQVSARRPAGAGLQPRIIGSSPRTPIAAAARVRCGADRGRRQAGLGRRRHARWCAMPASSRWWSAASTRLKNSRWAAPASSGTPPGPRRARPSGSPNDA